MKTISRILTMLLAILPGIVLAQTSKKEIFKDIYRTGSNYFAYPGPKQQKLTPAQVREVIIDIRRNKLPAPEETGSAGSFFRNPFVLPEQYAKVAKVAEKEGLGPVPHFPGDDGLIKIPAAWLIEKCGWKGYVEGNAGVYRNQPLVIINATGKATPDEILALESKIVSSVREKFGILLRPEVEHI